MMLDLERLRKIWTLVERGGSAGERAAAKDRACAIAGRHGYVLEDIPVLLAGGNVHKAREVRERQQREKETQRQEAEEALAKKAALKAHRQALRDQANEITGRYEGRLFHVMPDEHMGDDEGCLGRELGDLFRGDGFTCNHLLCDAGKGCNVGRDGVGRLSQTIEGR